MDLDTQHEDIMDVRTIQAALEHTLAEGGATLDPLTLGDYFADGWAVGGARGIETVEIDLADPNIGLEFAHAYLAIISNTRGELPVDAVGTWVDEGQLHVDAVDIIEDTDLAISVAYERREKAIYHLTTKRTLEIS